MYPLRRPVRPILFLPNRHQLLEPIDGMAASIKRLSAMRATDRHGDTNLANVQMAEAVHHHDLTHRPALTCFTFDFDHFLFSHAGIGLVIQGNGGPVRGEVADGAQECNDRTATLAANLLSKCSVVDHIAGELDHESYSNTCHRLPGATMQLHRFRL